MYAHTLGIRKAVARPGIRVWFTRGRAPHTLSMVGTGYTQRVGGAPRAENAKINVTDEPYFGTYILCNYLPFSKADKGAQGGPQQHETPKHSPTDISKRK